MGPPRAVVPGVVPVERIVARSDDVVVYLSGFWAYPAGFEVQVRVLVEDEENELDPFSFADDGESARQGRIPPGKLRIGFEFADGSKVTNTGDDFAEDWAGASWPMSPKMSSTVGRGGRRNRLAAGFWVWPLPPEGRLIFACEWPAAKIPLTRAAFDADQVIEAAQRARELLP
jgi:hypothetical protein